MRQQRGYWVVALALLLWASGAVIAAAHDIYDVQQAIQENDARWVPGENSISRLSDAERMSRLGHTLNTNTMGAPVIAGTFSSLPLHEGEAPVADAAGGGEPTITNFLTYLASSGTLKARVTVGFLSNKFLPFVRQKEGDL